MDDEEPTIPKNESAHKNVSSVQRKAKNAVTSKGKKANNNIGTPINSHLIMEGDGYN